jgi:hypothetical protein
MKNTLFILAMLLMAATTFSQTSRRPANTREPAGNEDRRNNHSISREHTEKNTTGHSSDQNKYFDHQRNSTPNSTNIHAKKDAGNNVRHNGSVNKDRSHSYVHNEYHSPRKSVEYRHINYNYKQKPHALDYRREHYPYRKPERISVVWTPEMHIEYRRIYPMVKHWHYPVGYRIPIVSAYDAFYYNGEVVNVYGKVYEVYYSLRSDEYILYFGAYYPFHDFTVVVPGNIARNFSFRPERYFNSAYVLVTGLVTIYDGKPEIYLSRKYQIRLY